ncbi:hypothetical protein Rsub_12138 [Raphidocelis subcapitata]|uniref:Uncharacterized protein n=1 Tax=Raphidocelis subcapitata TaxID=307507 RepID=A0A2V0PNG4_9CHLO|nr:hypothetical protein Rsub_12138 [Raphidocelis subcapitata]|eukprot:GBF99470.1 hypothetical protein Rsub_12138 [Raphidocelis subcapitata]
MAALSCVGRMTAKAPVAGSARAAVVVRPAVRPAQARPVVAARVAAPLKEEWNITHHTSEDVHRGGLPQLITRETVRALEAELDNGEAVEALRRFNANLRALPADRWESVLRPVFNELCFNLESFNPAFAACVLMVQKTIGVSDYVRRDMALKNLIQPLAGEYGMHNGQPQLKTHRELFSDFFQSLFGYPLADLIADSPTPEAAAKLFAQMMRDIEGGGGEEGALEKACYALGYNLAIEYLADYEKTWMLDSFRVDGVDISGLALTTLRRGLSVIPQEPVVFSGTVHAEGEAEHAAIGHNAVLNLVPAAAAPLLRRAMADHDRDFAAFYNRAADMLAA